MNFWLKDPATQEPDVTLTAFISGFVVALGKLALAGVTILNYVFPAFSGSDFAVVLGSLGAIYVAKSHSRGLIKNQDKK